jgi:hypothetical protein
MIIRVHNNDDSDYIDYEADTVEEIREMAKQRITLAEWSDGWSEVIEP